MDNVRSSLTRLRSPDLLLYPLDNFIDVAADLLNETEVFAELHIVGGGRSLRDFCHWYVTTTAAAGFAQPV